MLVTGRLVVPLPVWLFGNTAQRGTVHLGGLSSRTSSSPLMVHTRCEDPPTLPSLVHSNDPTQSFDESHKEDLVKLIKELSNSRQLFIATKTNNSHKTCKILANQESHYGNSQSGQSKGRLLRQHDSVSVWPIIRRCWSRLLRFLVLDSMQVGLVGVCRM